MLQDNEIQFTGTICKARRLISDGQHAIVLLTTLTDGFKYAVINNETRGRSDVLSQIGGRFKEGVSVKGVGLRGLEAIRATKIELAR